MVVFVAQQRPDHGVVAGDELDDQRGLESGQPLDELVQRNIGADDHVVNQGQAQDEVGLGALVKRPALGTAPAQVWRRVCQITDKGENRGVGCGFEGLIQAFNDQRINVHGHDCCGALSGDTRKGAGITAEIPHHGPVSGLGDAAHKIRFLGVLGLGIGRVLGIVRPGGLGALPAQFLDESGQTGDVGLNQLGIKAGTAQGVWNVPGCVGIAGLGLGLQIHVAEDPGPEPITDRHELATVLGVNPVNAAPQPRLKGHVFIGLEEQRIQKQLTKLAIANPRFTRREGRKRGDVDKNGLAANPLNIEGRRVFEDHAFCQRNPEQLKL